ncbi:MAG: hypothetical protein ABIO86_05170 [Sphingomonas sp.]
MAATCRPAIMIVANLRARIAGYGFAIFIGGIAWRAVGAVTG